MQISYTQFLAAEFTVVVFTNKTHRLIVLLFDDLIILKKKKIVLQGLYGQSGFFPSTVLIFFILCNDGVVLFALLCLV